jgi:hypothetical protein
MGPTNTASSLVCARMTMTTTVVIVAAGDDCG